MPVRPQAKAVGDALRAALAGAVRDLALEVTANLIEACPVDTGHVRRNFVPSLGSPFAGEDDGAAQAAGQAAVIGYQLDDGPVFVTNNVSYLPYLIGGSSQQAPAGWDLVALDQAVATVQARHDGVSIDLTERSVKVSAAPGRDARGRFTAGGK